MIGQFNSKNAGPGLTSAAEPLLSTDVHSGATAWAEAVFLDRDGVINENRSDHVKSWSEFRFLPGVPEAIRRLTRAGCKVFVISNQAMVNRGIVSHQTVDEV